MKDWQKKEKEDEKAFGGRRQKSSGSQWDNPGDVKSEIFLIDSKHTDKSSYSISIKTWDKLYEESLFARKLPVLSLEIKKLELVVLDKNDFLKLLK